MNLEKDSFGVEKSFKLKQKTHLILQNSPEFNLKLIGTKQGLNLLKSWLGREKNLELEIFYRGSKDGFMDFL